MNNTDIRILIIGENFTQIKSSIKIAGAKFYHKHTSLEAQKLIRNERPDVVILNIGTALKRGCGQVGSLLKSFPGLLIIGISNISIQKPYTDFIASGAEDCISFKNIEMLTTAITHSIARRKNSIHERAKTDIENFKLITEYINDVIWIMDGNLKFLYLSPSIKKLRGFTPEEVMNQRFDELFIPESLERVSLVIKDFKSRLQTKEKMRDPYRIEVYQPCKNGKVIPVEVVVNPIYDSNDNFKYFLGVSRDISERKINELELLESQERYRFIVENQNDLILKLDPEFNIMFASKQFCETFNKTEEELIGKSFMPLIHPEDRENVLSAMSKLFKKPYTTVYVERALTNKGWTWFEWSDKAIVDSKGIIKEIIAVGRDIQEKKIAVEAVTESERKYSTLIENLPGMVYSCFNIKDWTMEFVSKGSAELTGYTPDELQRDKFISYNEIIHPDDRKNVWDVVQQAIEKREHFELMYRIISKDGKEKWVWERGSYARKLGEQSEMLEGFIFDITDRVEAEQALSKSEEKFRFISENAEDLIYLYQIKPEPGFKYVSPSSTKMTGYTPEEHYADPELGFKLVHPEDIHILEETKQGKNQGESLVLRWLKKDGTTIWTEQKNVLIFDEKGELEAIQGIARDISVRKRTEEQLREKEFFLRESQRIAKIGSFKSDLKTGLWEPSETLMNILGIDENFKQTRKAWINLIHPEDRKEILNYINSEIDVKHLQFNREYRIVRHFDKEVRWIHSIGELIFDQKGNPVQMIGTIQDITERKLTEISIMKREEKYHNIFSSVNDALILMDLRGNILDCNEKAAEYFGGSKMEMIGVQFNKLNIVPKEFTKDLLKNFEKALTKKELKIEFSFVNKKGVSYTLDCSTKRISSSEKTTGLVIVCHDITKRKEIENDLKKRNEFIQTVLDNLPIGIALNRINDSKATYMNKKFEEIYGWSSAELQDIGSFFERVYPDEDYRKNLISRIMTDIQSGDASRMHWENIIANGKDGSKRMINAVNIPLFKQNTMVSTVIDVTKEMKIEKELKESEEKYRGLFNSIDNGILLTEVNRRIVDVNPAFRSMFGYELNEIKGMNTECLYNDINQFNETGAKIRELLETGKPFTRIIDFKRKTGIVFKGETSIFYLKEESGEIIGLIGLIRDVTQSLAIENELQEQQEKLNNIIKHSNELFYLHDTEHNLLYVSPQSQEMFGYSPNEMKVKWTTLTTDNPINQFGFEKTMLAIQTGKRQEPYLLELVKKDKSIIIVEVAESPVLDEDGNVTAIAGALRNITEKFYRDKELKSMASFVELNPYPTISYNLDGIVTYANPAASSIFGVSVSKDLLLSVLFPEQNIEEFISTIKRESTFTFYVKSENRTYLMIAKGIPESKSGYIYGADISSLNKIQEDLGKNRNQLQSYAAYLQSVREEERLSIARELHDDFSQILSAMKMFLTTILKKVETQQTIDTLTIKNEIVNMNQMLDKAIISVRNVLKKLRPEVLEDFGLLEAIKILIDDFIKSSGIPCNLECSLEEIKLEHLEQLALYRICQEALTNIARHSAATTSSFQIKAENNKYILLITDNGQGFEHDILFKKESFGIIGMRERAAATGGELIIKSNRGEGTQLKIVVPF